MDRTGRRATRAWSASRTNTAAVGFAWAVAVVLFAAQWYAYDESRARAERFAYYLGWAGYMWALLTPSALWMAWRFPITAANWTRRVPLHLAASVVLTGVQLSLEAYLGWLRHGTDLSPTGAFRHYFSQHTQVSLLTYWLLVAAVWFYRSRAEARDNARRAIALGTRLRAARLEVLRRQLHPHFLFNTLQAATTLVHEDPDRAEDVLLRLSDLLRVSLRESRAQQIPLGRELGILDHYMGIQTCRFQDRLRFEVCVPEDVRRAMVPALVLQPIVENAVRYGVGRHRESDTVTIRATQVGSALHLEVRNLTSTLDGPRGAAGRRGFGLSSTRERLARLYGRERSALRLTSLPRGGVSTEVVIPWRVAGEPAPAMRRRAHAHPRPDR